MITTKQAIQDFGKPNQQRKLFNHNRLALSYAFGLG